MHFKTTESGATAYIRTGKTDTVRDRKSLTGENAEPENGRKGWVKVKKEILSIYIWIITAIFTYKWIKTIEKEIAARVECVNDNRTDRLK
ncbi:hypothetical protein [Bacteroides sp.]|uniref:hypothetical protein n=1 Tax=Bacteroides sp. TaxID=29523 RepID=UPI003AB2E852